MTAMKPTQVLRKYFNTAGDPTGYEHKPAGEFLKELRELSPEDKAELVELAAADMGVEVE